MLLLQLDNASVRRGGTTALGEVSWELHTEENWAIIGGNGAGKSTFLSLVRGDIWPTQGMGVRHYFDASGTPSLSPIGFREHTTTVSAELIEHYLLLERVLDGWTLLMTGLRNTPLVYAPPTDDEWEQVHRLAKSMNVVSLLDKPLPECSTGQIKRLFLARTIASKPRMVFLDEYADGLDRSSRTEVMMLIDRLGAEGTQILCATHRATELPACINRVLMLEKGRVIHAGPHFSRQEASAHGAGFADSGILPEAVQQTASMDFSLLPEPRPVNRDIPVLSLNNATAGIEGTVIVGNVHWTVLAGQRWMVTGANGAGKSTLLRMVSGELPAALGGDVRWFGQGRMLQSDHDPDADGAGETFPDFWAIRQRMGLVTPRLQILHRMEIQVLAVVLSGFWQHIGLHEFPTRAMTVAAENTLAALGISDLAERGANTLSYGQLRKVIFARALVNQPSILLLDEPFSGLDAPSRADMQTILNGLADKGLTMILATHHPQEHEQWATNRLHVDAGKAVIVDNGTDLPCEE